MRAIQTILWLLLIFCSARCSAERTAAPVNDRGAVERLNIGGATITTTFEGDPGNLNRVSLNRWINTAATAVTHYFGHFPVKRLDLTIRFDNEDTVHNGVTNDGGRIRIQVGRKTSTEAFDTDWILTHEMFHLAFPSQDTAHHWMEEGLSTYLEPIARTRTGVMSVNQFWLETVQGMPQGLPEAGDGGLNGTQTWGRTYWGGASFWLIADVRIRERTENRKSLDDAIRTILSAGGDGSVEWPATRVFEVGDKATGTHVLTELYTEMGLKRATPDLAVLWKRLGVINARGRVTFDDTAPLATIRRSMTIRAQSR